MIIFIARGVVGNFVMESIYSGREKVYLSVSGSNRSDVFRSFWTFVISLMVLDFVQSLLEYCPKVLCVSSCRVDRLWSCSLVTCRVVSLALSRDALPIRVYFKDFNPVVFFLLRFHNNRAMKCRYSALKHRKIGMYGNSISKTWNKF